MAIPQWVFNQLMATYKGNYKIRQFSCPDKMMCMMFGQLSNGDSLSDLVANLNAHPGNFYHLCFGRGDLNTNSADANEKETGLFTSSMQNIFSG